MNLHPGIPDRIAMCAIVVGIGMAGTWLATGHLPSKPNIIAMCVGSALSQVYLIVRDLRRGERASQ